MASIRHPFDPDMIYSLDEDGNIRITRGTEFGVFTPRGEHLEGAIRQADPQLCVWIGNVINDPESSSEGIAKASMIARLD